MPIYNSELFLAEAIDSILGQTYVDFEFIIIDDGSTDNSLTIAEKFRDIDARISVYSQPNQGISKTRNRLLSLCKGTYIAWMDSDDISLPGRLTAQYNYLLSNVDVVAVGGGTEFIDDEGMTICDWLVPRTHEGVDQQHIDGHGGAITFPASMMLKMAIDKVGGFDENLTGAEDLCLFLRLAEVGKLANLNDRIYQYRQHENSISHASKIKILKDRQIVINNTCLRRGLAPKVLSMDNKCSRKVDIYIKWGWWALNGNNVLTARKYAKKAMFVNPCKVEVWKLLACSIRGY